MTGAAGSTGAQTAPQTAGLAPARTPGNTGGCRPIPTPSEIIRSYERDIAAIAKIDVIPLVLEVVCRTTGMGFSAVARVTEDRWIACAVRDEIDFGLVPGGELEIESTICNEIRESGELVVIDDVACDATFRGTSHAQAIRLPKLYLGADPRS